MAKVWSVALVFSLCALLWTVSRLARRSGPSCSQFVEDPHLRTRNLETPDPSSIHEDNLYKALQEIEWNLIFHSPSKTPLVVAKDISFGRYYAQRDIQGWSLAYANQSFQLVEQSFRTQVKISELSVFLCLGIQSQDKHCLRPSSFQTLHRTQKYNQIYGLRDVLWRKDGFCYTMREALQGYRGSKSFVFPCWVLPMDRQSLEREMNRSLASWIVKPSGQGEGHGIFVVNYFSEILSRHEIINNFVVQPLLTNPYLVEGKKFDFRTYVLVTSILPLRAYFYKEGLVRFASSKYNPNATKGGSEREYLTNTSIGKKYTHLSNLTWTFQKLKDYFAAHGVDGEKVFEGISEAIAKTLLAAEYRFQRNYFLNLGGYDCQSCFQLLGVDVILDSELRPHVIEVNGLPSMQLSHDLGAPPDPSNPYTITKFGLMRDILQMLFKPTSVAKDVSRHLKTLGVGIKPGPLCSPDTHTFCVDFKELQKLLDSRREFVNKGGFQRIYPSIHGSRYSKLIQRMDGLIEKKFSEVGAPFPRTLWHMHHLYTALENLYFL